MKSILNSKFLCPKVGTKNALTREAWVKSKLSALPMGTILDAGAGEQIYKTFCRHLEYVSQDFEKYSGAGDGRGLQMGAWNYPATDIVSDIISIPRPSDSFDAILNTEVLEHLPDPIRALQEFHRLLRPGGKLILTAPFSSLTHFSPYHFYSGFNRYFFEYHFDKLGFKIEELSYNGNFFEFVAQEMRRTNEMASKYCGTSLRLYERIIFRLALFCFQRLAERDSGSSECLSFGLNILATKN